MDLISISKEAQPKPSKLMALIALSIAFALPFILVKSFPHKHKASYTLAKTFSAQEDLSTKLSVHQDMQLQKPLSNFNSTLQTVNPAVKLETVSLPQNPKNTYKNQAKNNTTTPPVNSGPSNAEWQTVLIQKGDSLSTIFKHLGLNPNLLSNAVNNNLPLKALSNLKANQRLQVLIKQQVLEKIQIPLTTTEYLEISRQGTHYKHEVKKLPTTVKTTIISAVIHGSLYGTAKHQHIPFSLVQQMTEIFTWDINFAKDVRTGDQFTIIYNGIYSKNKLVHIGDLLAVSYKNKGKIYQAFRYTNKNNHTDYYSTEGRSFKKAFDRYPLPFSHISSPFRLSRYHPILHYKRPHLGIDLAAPLGTPIHATGDGRIAIIGRHSGYGNMIRLVHNKTYSSVYAHLLRFQKGLSQGQFVKRGQTIGYVGQTGLASGPHCHYEFHINNHPQNPTTVMLPKGLSLLAQEMQAFKQQSTYFLAQLKLFEGSNSRLAMSGLAINSPDIAHQRTKASSRNKFFH